MGRLTWPGTVAMGTVAMVAVATLSSCTASSARPSEELVDPPAGSLAVPTPTSSLTIPPDETPSALGESPAAGPEVVPGDVLPRLGRHPRAVVRLPAPQSLPRAAKQARVSGPVAIVHANLYTGMTSAAFAADLAQVVSARPDVVTLNEAHRRSLDEITPAGYAAHRREAPKEARETPVLWRTDRWKSVDAGTFLMHDRPVKWGTRYVNWVTLEEIGTGARVSVISGHAAPRGPGRDGLLGIFLARLDLLAGELDDRGPVLIGADLNTYYERSPFLRRAFPRSGAVSTFDLLGEPQGGWATGDGGRTIDYVLTTRALPLRHSTTPLAGSDHRMVSVTLEVLPGL